MAERGRPRSFDLAAALRRAMEVFWARGYDGASMTDLTAAMGINSPSLYAAFGCKEALFREALELYESGEGGSASRSLQDAPTARASAFRSSLPLTGTTATVSRPSAFAIRVL